MGVGGARRPAEPRTSSRGGSAGGFAAGRGTACPDRKSNPLSSCVCPALALVGPGLDCDWDCEVYVMVLQEITLIIPGPGDK